MLVGGAVLNKNDIYLIILLTPVWIILCEGFSVAAVMTGIIVSAGCVYFCHKYIPLNIINVDFLKLATYPFYLIGQIYLAGFAAIKIILTGASVGVVEVETKITSDFLKVVLVNSITLIPGSVSLELKGQAITILWLRGKNDDPQDVDAADKLMKSELERRLLKAQK